MTKRACPYSPGAPPVTRTSRISPSAGALISATCPSDSIPPRTSPRATASPVLHSRAALKSPTVVACTRCVFSTGASSSAIDGAVARTLCPCRETETANPSASTSIVTPVRPSGSSSFKRSSTSPRSGSFSLTGLQAALLEGIANDAAPPGRRRSGCRAAVRLDERAERAEALVAEREEIGDRYAREPLELGDKRGLDRGGRRLVIGVGAARRLAYERVGDAGFEEVGSGELHGDGRPLGLARAPPQDRGAALRRNHGVGRVLEREHDIAHAECERAARAALAEHDDHDRHAEAGHELDARSDRLRLPSLLGLRSRIRARCIHQSYKRQMKFLREAVEPHRLAVPLWVGHPEVALDVLLGRRTLLLADDHHRPPVN